MVFRVDAQLCTQVLAVVLDFADETKRFFLSFRVSVRY